MMGMVMADCLAGLEDEMLRGALISNAFLRTGKFVEHYEWLREAAERQGMALSLFDNTKLCRVMDSGVNCRALCDGGHNPVIDGGERYRGWECLDSVDFVIFWDKDIPGGKFMEAVCRKRGIPVYNSIDAIACCDHKFFTYVKMWEWNRRRDRENEIGLIPTVMAPMTYENIGYTSLDFVENIIDGLGLPLIVKECCGSFGMQVYKADTRRETYSLTEKLAGKSFLYQKYIEHSAGNDVRIQVVGGRAVAAMHRFSRDGDFRANLSNGGSMEPYQPSEEECRIAVQACDVLGLDFAGVDLLFDEKGRAVVLCEVNSNAHFKNIHACTGVNVADCIMEYIRGAIHSSLIQE